MVSAVEVDLTPTSARGTSPKSMAFEVYRDKDRSLTVNFYRQCARGGMMDEGSKKEN